MVYSTCLHSIDESIRATLQLKLPHNLVFMESAARLLTDTFQNGKKVLIAGNGGSLCDASHFAEELTGFFRKKRRALPAIALSDPGHITCVGNDLGFEHVFSRGLESLAQPGDVFIGLTTSGQSKNIVAAFHTAKALGCKTLSFLGREGGCLKGVADHELIICDFSTSDRIQEAHMAALHIIIELIEMMMFPQENDRMNVTQQPAFVCSQSY